MRIPRQIKHPLGTELCSKQLHGVLKKFHQDVDMYDGKSSSGLQIRVTHVYIDISQPPIARSAICRESLVCIKLVAKYVTVLIECIHHKVYSGCTIFQGHWF